MWTVCSVHNSHKMSIYFPKIIKKKKNKTKKKKKTSFATKFALRFKRIYLFVFEYLG